jgi:hypothetical protein
MKSCDLHEVIICPSGSFTSTGAKTCILFFTKKKERNEVIINFNNKKLPKFINEHSTSKVKFYNFNLETEKKEFIKEVNIKDIANNNYSLSHTDYEVEEEKIITNEKFELKQLGEICEFLPKSKRNAKYGKTEGKFPFFKSSLIINSYVDNPDYKVESIIIGDGGDANINYATNFSTSDHCYILQNLNNQTVNLKYIYYYIYTNLNILQKFYKGALIKNISKSDIEKIKIPIPSIETQNKIVEYMDSINESSTSLKNQIQSLKNNQSLSIEMMISNKKKYKMLGEICEFLPKSKRNAKYGKTEGKYPFYTSSQTCSKYSDEYDYKDYAIIIGTGGTANIKYDKQFSCSADNLIIEINDKHNSKYIYYYLLLNIQKLEQLFKGALIKHISKTDIEKIKIPIPLIETQNKIVEQLDSIDNLINLLQKQIDNNHKYAKEFILNFTNNLDTTNNEDNDDEDNEEENSDNENSDNENNDEEENSDEEHKSNSSDESD